MTQWTLNKCPRIISWGTTSIYQIRFVRSDDAASSVILSHFNFLKYKNVFALGVVVIGEIMVGRQMLILRDQVRWIV